MTPPPALIRLHRGQAHGFRAEAGSMLLVEHGAVMLTTAPRWLAGMVWRSQRRLAAGEAQVLDAGGWVTLCTIGNLTAEVWCFTARPSPAAPHRFTRSLRSFARRALA